MTVRNGRRLTYDQIWDELWTCILGQIDATGGLKRDGHSPPQADGVPVDPDRPNSLSGGAAAPLEYDD